MSEGAIGVIPGCCTFVNSTHRRVGSPGFAYIMSGEIRAGTKEMHDIDH